MNPTQPPQKIVPDYVKFVEVTWNAMDITLLLSKASFDAAPGAPFTDGGKFPVGAISISPIMAKALAKDLAAAVEACERQFGPIAAPPENANVVTLRPVEPATNLCEDEGCPNHGTPHVCRTGSEPRFRGMVGYTEGGPNDPHGFGPR